MSHNKLYGLADSNEIEIVECVYDNIKHLKSGKYIVIKDKMAGVLDERGKILLYLQPNRLYTIQQMDIFYYNETEVSMVCRLHEIIFQVLKRFL